MSKVFKEPVFFFVALYIALCQISPYTEYLPFFIRSWRLFDNWVTPSNYFLDIEYTADGQKNYLSRNSIKFKNQIDIVAVYYHFIEKRNPKYFHKIKNDFEKVCRCETVKLVRVEGLLSDHIYLDRRKVVTEVYFDE